MTEKVGFLRHLSTGGIAAKLLPPYPLNEGQEILMGRDPNCQVILDANLYTGVSRRHGVIRPVAGAVANSWEICDLNSANGIYVNGKQLEALPDFTIRRSHYSWSEWSRIYH